MRPEFGDREALIDVAMGRASPDLVIKDALVANVLTRELVPCDVLVKGQRIAALGRAEDYRVAPSCEIVSARGLIAAPALIDPHVHIESSCVTAGEYARIVVPRGIATVAADPHEIANVLGLPGIEALFEDARRTPLRVLLRVPGRVPAMPPELETSFGQISVKATAALLDWPEAVCLAGDINPRLVVEKDPEQLAKFRAAVARGMTISGQSPALTGGRLCAFVAGGAEDSHVARDLDEIIENARLGLRSVLATRPGRRLDEGHFRALADWIRAGRIDTRTLQFCTDDVHPHYLLAEGHLEQRIRMAIRRGFDPLVALQMATINVAQGLRIDRDLGSITPGKFADIVLVGSLENFTARAVYAGGRLVARDGALIDPLPDYRYPDVAHHSMRCRRTQFTAADLSVAAPPGANRVDVRVVVAGAVKEQAVKPLDVHDGVVLPDPGRDIAAFVVIERHRRTGGIGRGFLTGISLRHGAIASTVSHDAHNIFVIGADYADMAVAVNRLVALGGGYVAARAGQVLCEVPLPIAGLMSYEPMAVVAHQHEELERVLARDLGCSIGNRPLYVLNFLCLPNIPKVGITDKGIIDVQSFEPLPPILGAAAGDVASDMHGMG